MSSSRGGDQLIPRPDNWVPGRPAPWLGRDLSLLSDHDATVDALRRYLDNTPPGEHPSSWGRPADPRYSAVLVALHEVNGAPAVILTRRAKHLSNHKGEVSFPGGRLEPDESFEAAALREAQEEVALEPGIVRTLGRLDSLVTNVSNSHITPVVATLDAQPTLVPHAAEVDRIIQLPLTELVHPDAYHSESWTTPRGQMDINFFEIEGDTVWGATGRILHQLLDILTRS